MMTPNGGDVVGVNTEVTEKGLFQQLHLQKLSLYKFLRTWETFAYSFKRLSIHIRHFEQEVNKIC